MSTIRNEAHEQFENMGRHNPRNRVNFSTAGVKEIGVAVKRAGMRKATTLELIVPARRSARGSRRVVAMNLNGAQARALFNTLQSFYDENPRSGY